MSRRAESIVEYLFGVLVGGLVVYWLRPADWWVVPVSVVVAAFGFATIELLRAWWRDRRNMTLTWRCRDCGLVIEMTRWPPAEAHDLLCQLYEQHMGHQVIMETP